jgi:hypothetical protein
LVFEIQFPKILWDTANRFKQQGNPGWKLPKKQKHNASFTLGLINKENFS